MTNSEKKILIAEDDKPISKAMQLKLESSGYTVDVAQDGKIALEMLEETEYDLLLLDIVMPVLNGFKVLEELKNKESSIPVIVMSNLGQAEDIEKAKSLGAKNYFIKSNIDLNEVVTNVEKHFNS